MTTTTDPALLEACRTYLRNKHTTLWADYDISDPQSPRTEAATVWLCEQIQGVADAATYFNPPNPAQGNTAV